MKKYLQATGSPGKNKQSPIKNNPQENIATEQKKTNKGSQRVIRRNQEQ